MMMMIVAAHARFQFEQSVTRPEKKYLKSVERTDGAERKPGEERDANGEINGLGRHRKI